MNKSRALALLGAFALGPVSHAQIQVAVRATFPGEPVPPPVILSGVVTQPGNHVRVDTGQLAAALGSVSPITIWVYDQAVANTTPAVPTLDVGSITIDYSVATFQPDIKLIVGSPSTPENFPGEPTQSIAAGVRNLGSITVIPDAFPNFNEAQLVAAAIAVTGDVGDPNHTSPRDKIDVGVVYRLQVAGRPGAVSERDGGHIYADVIARSSDNATGTNSQAIGFVTASDTIRLPSQPVVDL